MQTDNLPQRSNLKNITSACSAPGWPRRFPSFSAAGYPDFSALAATSLPHHPGWPRAVIAESHRDCHHAKRTLCGESMPSAPARPYRHSVNCNVIWFVLAVSSLRIFATSKGACFSSASTNRRLLSGVPRHCIVRWCQRLQTWYRAR